MVSATRIPATALRGGEPWDPRLFCGAGAEASLVAGGLQVTVGELGGTCVDGWRDAGEHLRSASARIPVYRQAHLGKLRLRLEGEHWESPVVGEDVPTVEPGDVVVNKFPPVRAAWATTRLHRHPVDANCLLVKKLDLTAGFWLAVCLNHPLYEERLLREAAASTLPRVGLRALRQLRVPPTPPDTQALALQVWDFLDQDLANQAEGHALIREADALVSSLSPGDQAGRLASGGGPWWRTIPATALEDSLVPEHAIVGVRQAALTEQGGWLELGSLLGTAASDGRRLHELPSEGAFLQLGDAGPALSVRMPEERESLPAPRHVFHEPLGQDDCLLSATVGQPRVAFAGSIPPARIWITDSWIRLRFRETPGAWALLLATPTIMTQLQHLASASSRRIGPEVQSGGVTLRLGGLDAVLALLVPAVPLEVRLRWDRALRTLQVRRLNLENGWDRLWQRVHQLFVHGHGRSAGHATAGVKAG